MSGWARAFRLASLAQRPAGRSLSLSKGRLAGFGACGRFDKLSDRFGRRRRLEGVVQFGGGQRQGIERESRGAQPQGGERRDRQPHAELVQLLGASAQHAVDRAVGEEASGVVEHDDTIDEPDGRVEVVLDEDDRAVPGGDEIGERRVHLVDPLGIEVGGGLVEHEQR